MVRVVWYDPGRIRDRFAMLAANITAEKIQILNAKEWKKTDFTIAEDEVAAINAKRPFQYHYCETNNQGWHVIDNLRRYKRIPVIGINTGNNLTNIATIRLGRTMDKNKTVDWVEWARMKGIIEMPAKPWSIGIVELNKQLDRFVMKPTSSGVKYEAAEDDDHDDLVMCILGLAHVARFKFLRLNGMPASPAGIGHGASHKTALDLEAEITPEDRVKNKLKERFKSLGVNVKKFDIQLSDNSHY